MGTIDMAIYCNWIVRGIKAFNGPGPGPRHEGIYPTDPDLALT